VDGDHVGGVPVIGDGGIGRKLHVAASKGSTTESHVKHGASTFEAEEALFEPDASGLGGGEDEACEVEGFVGLRRYPQPRWHLTVVASTSWQTG